MKDTNSKLSLMTIRLLGKILDIEPLYSIRHLSFMPDKYVIKHMYKKILSKNIDINNPTTFNEKNNWRKLYERDNKYTLLVDKYKLKEYVENKVGEGHSANIIGVWDSPRDINFKKLPERFVLKVNHAGGVIVCKDKESFDIQKAVEELERKLKMSYYVRLREWPYKNVKRKVLCEEYLGDDLIDYKNYCFNGQLHYTFVWKNFSRPDGRKPTPYFCGAYDKEWNKISLELDYDSKDINIEKPDCYNEMVSIAEKLSAGIPFVRVDCFIDKSKVLVGEMTFFPWGGYQKFKNSEWDIKLGQLINLKK